MDMHSQWKKPLSAMPSTMIIIPQMKKIVSQLIPVEAEPPPWLIQKEGSAMLYRLSASHAAAPLCMQTPNTTTRVSPPHTSVTRCRGNFSMTMRANITRKIPTATT